MLLVPGRVYRRRRLLVGGATLLLVGGAAYKIGQAQAQQIQQYAGRPPEDLSQDELERAMDALGIESQDLSAEDKVAIEAEAVDPAAEPTSPTTSTAPETDVPDYIAELERLAELRDAGIVTNEEFEAKKKQLLDL
jgi:hypothetical protein